MSCHDYEGAMLVLCTPPLSKVLTTWLSKSLVL